MVTGLIRDSSKCPPDEKGPFPARILLSKSDTRDFSVKHGVLPIGRDIKVHMHEDNAQMEFYTSGKAILFVEGVGERKIGPGSFMYVPKGVRHGLHSVREPLGIISVFVPPLF